MVSRALLKESFGNTGFTNRYSGWLDLSVSDDFALSLVLARNLYSMPR